MVGTKTKWMRYFITKLSLLLVTFLFFLVLQGCASSDLSRQAACGIDQAYDSVAGGGGGYYSDFDLAESYQGLNQTTKGVLIGGVTGGVVGGASSGIGAWAGTATGAILGGAIGAYIDAHSCLIDKLENRGAKVFILGDQVMIVLSSSQIFYGRSANLRYSAYTTLALVNRLIGNFANMSVKVAAYIDPAAGPECINRAFTQQQAESIAKYLWRTCITTRMMYAVGCGGSHPVAVSKTNWEYSDNYRIEITFEKLPV